MSTADRLDAAHANVTAREAQTAAAGQEVAELLRAEAEATTAFDESGDDAALEALTRATLRRERAERLEVTARVAEAGAKAKLAAAEHAAASELLEHRRAHVEAWRTGVANDVEVLVGLDRAADAAVGRIAERIADAEDAYSEAKSLALSIGRLAEFDRSTNLPSLRDARAFVAKAVATARAEEERGATAAWFAGGEALVTLRADTVRAMRERGISATEEASFIDRAVRDAVERSRYVTEFAAPAAVTEEEETA